MATKAPRGEHIGIVIDRVCVANAYPTQLIVR